MGTDECFDTTETNFVRALTDLPTISGPPYYSLCDPDALTAATTCCPAVGDTGIAGIGAGGGSGGKRKQESHLFNVIPYWHRREVDQQQLSSNKR